MAYCPPRYSAVPNPLPLSSLGSMLASYISERPCKRFHSIRLYSFTHPTKWSNCCDRFPRRVTLERPSGLISVPSHSSPSSISNSNEEHLSFSGHTQLRHTGAQVSSLSVGLVQRRLMNLSQKDHSFLQTHMLFSECESSTWQHSFQIGQNTHGSMWGV